MKKFGLIVFSVFAIACSESKQNNEVIVEQRDSLQFELDALKVQNDSLLKLNQQLINPVSLPKDTVVAALRSKPGIIPLEPVLGGSMRFGNIEIIDHELIIANYNDGHIEGTSIFKYEKVGDSIEFKPLYNFEN